MTPLTKRIIKNAELTWAEMDNNWALIEQEFLLKADVNHTHGIADVSGLQALLDGKINTTDKAAANGVASLDATGKVPASQLPASGSSLWQVIGTGTDIYYNAGKVAVGKNTADYTLDVWGNSNHYTEDSTGDTYSMLYNGLVADNPIVLTDGIFSGMNQSLPLFYAGFGSGDKYGFLAGVQDATFGGTPTLLSKTKKDDYSAGMVQTHEFISWRVVSPNQIIGETAIVITDSEVAVDNLRLTPYKSNINNPPQDGTLNYFFGGLEMYEGGVWTQFFLNKWNTGNPVFDLTSGLLYDPSGNVGFLDLNNKKIVGGTGTIIEVESGQLLNDNGAVVLGWSEPIGGGNGLVFKDPTGTDVAVVNQNGLSIDANSFINFSSQTSPAAASYKPFVSAGTVITAGVATGAYLLGEPDLFIKAKFNGTAGVIPFYYS